MGQVLSGLYRYDLSSKADYYCTSKNTLLTCWRWHSGMVSEQSGLMSFSLIQAKAGEEKQSKKRGGGRGKCQKSIEYNNELCSSFHWKNNAPHTVALTLTGGLILTILSLTFSPHTSRTAVPVLLGSYGEWVGLCEFSSINPVKSS